MTSTTTTRRYNRPGPTTNKQAANKAMSMLIDTLDWYERRQDR
ncbi:hypothetical protein [Corynebacterium belfantii]|nr:hypothetical protein [Corynebacterium belfantii]